MLTPATGYRPRPPESPHLGVAYRRDRLRLDASVTIDLRDLAPAARDQAQLGCCTGFTGRGCVQGLIEAARRDGIWTAAPFEVSPLALYAEARARRGALSLDDGASLAELVAVLSLRGLPREELWPYKPERFAELPPDDIWSGHHLVNHTPLRHQLEELRAALADGCPIAVGIPCFDGPGGIMSAEVFATGIVPMPSLDAHLVAWHAVSLWGHDPIARVFFLQNSWGGWASRSNGLGTIHESYVLGLANELYAFGAVR